MSERADARIEKEKLHMYDSLANDENSIFFKHNTSDIYVAAAAIGFYERKRVPLKSKHGLFIMNNMGKNNSGIWIIKSIGISQLGIDSLNQLPEVAKICDEYANYGIDQLYKTHTQGNGEIEFTNKMITILEEMEII